jgi:hypothetical protein
MNLANHGDSAEPVPNRQASTARQLDDLVNADRTALQDTWLKVFGRRPPVRLSRELLVLALSYQAQSQRSGGLAADELQALGIAGPDWIAGASCSSTTARKAGEAVVSRPPDGGRAPGGAGNPTSAERRASPRSVRRSIKPGTRLLREWQGETHEVIAESSGRFLYRGQTYRSLSAIARAITGTRWSGPTFFGVATNRQAKKAGGGGDA